MQYQQQLTLALEDPEKAAYIVRNDDGTLAQVNENGQVLVPTFNLGRTDGFFDLRVLAWGQSYIYGFVCLIALIVLYFAPPYCPHNMLQKECAFLEDNLKNIARKVGEEAKLEYRFMHFFPSLSDSSYLKIDDSDESIEKLKGNFPVMEQLYPVPLEKIKKLNIPSVDFGCYGKDAHKWTERVNVPYTFEVLPYLLTETLSHFGYIE